MAWAHCVLSCSPFGNISRIEKNCVFEVAPLALASLGAIDSIVYIISLGSSALDYREDFMNEVSHSSNGPIDLYYDYLIP